MPSAAVAFIRENKCEGRLKALVNRGETHGSSLGSTAPAEEGETSWELAVTLVENCGRWGESDWAVRDQKRLSANSIGLVFKHEPQNYGLRVVDIIGRERIME